MTVRTIARTEVATIEPQTPAEEVAARMREEQVGSLVVVDESGDLLGLVTDRDVGLGVWEHDDPRVATAADLMSRDPITVDADDQLYDALRTAREAAVRRLPVTEDGELVGIVTLDDALVLIAGELEEISGVVQGHSPPY